MFAGITKQLTFSGYNIPNSYKSSETKTVSATVSSGTGPYSHSWSSTIGGSFSNGTSASTNFTAPNTSVALSGVIKCTVIDACSRQNFISQVINVSANTLPVNLKYLSAKEDNGVVEINWITGSEINNDFFTIERSNNGFDFIEIGKVNGGDNSSHDITYSYTDKEPLIGSNYYRLIQTDYDGEYKIFAPVHVRFSLQKETKNYFLGISPMPFRNFEA